MVLSNLSRSPASQGSRPKARALGSEKTLLLQFSLLGLGFFELSRLFWPHRYVRFGFLRYLGGVGAAYEGVPK